MNWTFIVDTREKEVVRQRVFKKFENSKAAALHAGDFACKRGKKFLVGIERKSLEDFVNSIATKRIFSQMEKMHNVYPIGIVILEGNMGTLRGKLRKLNLDFNEPAFWGTAASIVVRDNFSIFWSPDRATTINMAYMLCTKIAEGKYKTIRRWQPKRKSTVISLLEMIPGVSRGIATQLLKKYKSIVNIGMQTQKELCSNKGVGPTLSKRIIKYLAEK